MASKIVINLDTSKENYLVAKCKQNDDLVLEASIFENGLEKDLTNAAITIQALKADKTYIIQNTNITKENNKIIANLDRDFSRVPGTTKIEIVLVESGKQNTAFSFCLEVVGSVIRGVVESSNTVTILEELEEKIVEAGQVRDETEQLIQSGGAATTGDIQEINSQLEQIMQQDIYFKSINGFDFSESMQAIIDNATINKIETTIYLEPNRTYFPTKTIDIDIRYVNIEGRNAIIKGDNLLSRDFEYPLFNIKCSGKGSDYPFGHFLKDLKLFNIRYNENNIRENTAINYDDVNCFICNIQLENIYFDGWAYNEIMRNNTFLIKHNNCNYINNDINIWFPHNNVGGYNNRGENLIYLNCYFSASKTCLKVDMNSDWNFVNCSFDYIDVYFYSNMGNIFCTNCFFEGYGHMISYNNCANINVISSWIYILNNVAKSNLVPFQATSQGVINIDKCYIVSDMQNWDGTITSGNGNVKFNACTQNANGNLYKYKFARVNNPKACNVYIEGGSSGTLETKYRSANATIIIDTSTYESGTYSKKVTKRQIEGAPAIVCVSAKVNPNSNFVLYNLRLKASANITIPYTVVWGNTLVDEYLIADGNYANKCQTANTMFSGVANLTTSYSSITLPNAGYNQNIFNTNELIIKLDLTNVPSGTSINIDRLDINNF